MPAKPVLRIIALLASAAAVAGCQHSNAPAQQAFMPVGGEERLLSSFCANGSCERVYTRYSDADLQRRFLEGRSRKARFEPFIVRVEPDSDYRPDNP